MTNTVKLKDICEFQYGKGLPQRERERGEFPVYGSGGIVDYHKTFLIEGPGIIVGRKGTIGSVFIEKRNFYPIDTVYYIRVNERLCDTKYLYYSLLTLGLNKLNTDAAVPGLNRNVAYEQTLFLPPKALQRKIASILSAYDDLIENNNRRIKILEEMAQAIYKEWFVNFRFPGHKKIKMVKSKMGMIPEGWEVKEMQEVADVIDCLHSKKPKEIENGNKFLLQLFNISEGGKLDLSKKYYISDEDYELWTRRIEASEGDCVITNVGRIAAVAQIPQGIKAALGRNMTAVRANKKFITPSFLIQYLLSPHMESEVLKKTDRGTIMDSLNVKNIVKLSINISTSEIMEKFDNAVKPIRRRIELLVNQNMILRKARDLLLPKLISGEVDVEKMDIKIVE